MIVTVGFGTEKRFHVEAFEGVYTPSQVLTAGNGRTGSQRQ